MADRLMTPPGTYADLLTPSPAPVEHDRGFLVQAAAEPLGLLTFSERLRLAATDLSRLPVDPLTELPHAILPIDVGDDPNYHHHFYNRRDPDLEGDHQLTSEQLANPEDIPLPIIAGLAVRISRGQLLSTTQHNLTHIRYKQGPVLPHTVGEKFVTAVKACSGVVSRFAIDITAARDDCLVYMEDDVFARVANSKVLCTERVYYDKPANHRRRILGNFFLRYAANQDLSHISERVIEEFLHTTSSETLAALGNQILREAVLVSIEPLESSYRELRQQGMVQPGRPEPRKAVWKYVHPDRRERVYRVLKKRLAA